MTKETADYLNSIGDLQERLDNAPECEMPYFDHTPDTLEDTGRNPEKMASETEGETWDEPTEEDIDTYRGYYDYRM